MAAGINLPARRVIIREVHRYEEGGNVPIPVMEIKQMCGRAGRPRYDTEGEAILVARNEDDASLLLENYLLGELGGDLLQAGQRGGPAQPCARHHRHRDRALLGGADGLLSATFFAHQSSLRGMEEAGGATSFEFLEKEGMIAVDEDQYRATLLRETGIATCTSTP